MFYMFFILLGLVLLAIGVWQYRQAEKKGLAMALIAVGAILTIAGGIFFYLISSGQLTLPLG